MRAAEAHIRLLTERLRLLNRQIAEADRRIAAFLEALGKTDPEPGGDGDPKPGQAEEHPDAAILRSLPGVGPVVLSTLLAEADDPLRRRDYHALRCLCGVAPVTRRSGRTLVVTRRLAVQNRLRTATSHWARIACAMLRDGTLYDPQAAL